LWTTSRGLSCVQCQGGTLQYTGSAVNSNRLLTIGSSGGALDASGSNNAAVNFTNSGALAFSGSGARTLELTGSSTANNTLGAAIGDASGGATSLLKSGSGTWVLTGSNNYSGDTTVLSGQLLAAMVTGSGDTMVQSGTLTAGYIHQHQSSVGPGATLILGSIGISGAGNTILGAMDLPGSLPSDSSAALAGDPS
jgi:fibronectin-binding autotransporter adhesin